MEKQYGSVAEFYDALNADFDYQAYASYIVGQIRANEKINSSLVLDLACGTGKMTFLLREHGYDMTGVDISEEMLGVARDICYDKGIDDVLLLCQGMQNFELYGTVDACVCCLDSLNYLTKIDDLKKCLSLVHNYLIPDGVFVFDINTPYRFRESYAKNDFILENDASLLAWQSTFNEKSGICKFYLSVFSEGEDGRYDRYDEIQTERCYSKRKIEALLRETGFEVISVYGDLNKKVATDTDEKWYFVCRSQ